MADAQVSIAQHYHSRTKYDPATLSAKARPIDFARQPVPFKTYQIGSEVDLKPYLEVLPAAADADTTDWMRLSRLLINSYGLTAKFPYQHRANLLFAGVSLRWGGFIRRNCI